MARIKEPLRVVDGIAYYSKEVAADYMDYHPAFLDNLYSAEENHFWFIVRRECILDAFSQYLPAKNSVLEIGAGTGYVAEGLQKKGYQVAVGEIHLSGLRYAKQKGISACYQFDLFDPPFQNEFDAIGMFDVLEHLDDDVHALRQVSKMLKPDGKLFITVPAHQWLWSRIDSISAHKRRYSKRLLMQRLSQAGMNVLECRFIFIAILPLLYLRHLQHRDSAEKITKAEVNTEIQINPIVNKVLLGLARLENRVSKWLPNVCGGSLLLIAEKK